MDRAGLKSKAKELIKGNKWFIWKPLIIFGLAFGLIEGIALGLDLACGFMKPEIVEMFGVTTTRYSGGILTPLASIFTGIAGSAFSVGYAYYVLSFIRGTKLELKDILEFMKKHWVIAVLSGLLAGVIIVVGMIALIIPGIIASIGLYYYKEVCADNLDLNAKEIVKKTWEMTKGHKMDLFVLGLSFIGWCFLAGFTFGILFIWVLPYMLVTYTLFYEEIKK